MQSIKDQSRALSFHDDLRRHEAAEWKHESIGKVTVVGAGLAGSEAAWQLAQRGVNVELYEMRPDRLTPAHRSADFAELVCSNSFKSLALPSAAATLKAELAVLGSFVLRVALQNRVRAGGALAVDRNAFARQVSMELRRHPYISVIHQEVRSLSEIGAKQSEQVIVATGPLTTDKLAQNISTIIGAKHLAFYDASAPLVEAESLDFGQLFAQSRYDKVGDDYLNAALDRQHYDRFVQALRAAQQVVRRSFETRELFQACQPIEEVAKSGFETLRHGALKPFGLRDPCSATPPYAVVQLRAENAARSAYNLVGFQTNLTFAEQQRVFSLIPGLQRASFSRFGVMHRNTFINSPRTLGSTLELPSNPHVRFAGQLTGTEGYTEAIASGLYAALNCYARLRGVPPALPPAQSTFGALWAYATSADTNDYQPMHVNYGIMTPLAGSPRQKRQRYAAYSQRALSSVAGFRAARADLKFVADYSLPEIGPTARNLESGEQV